MSKITTAKWAGGVAQEVECLLCKYKALNSNSSPTKKNKKRRRNNYKCSALYNIDPPVNVSKALRSTANRSVDWKERTVYLYCIAIC
jgi:hypothetical protein